MVMESSRSHYLSQNSAGSSFNTGSNYPQDDYALAILTQAAMHSNAADSSQDRSSYSNSNSTTNTSNHPAAAAIPAETLNHTAAASITNQRDESKSASLRGPMGTQSHSHPHPHSQSHVTSHNFDILNTYNPSAVSSTRMETLSYDPTHAGGHNPYMDSAFRGIGSQMSRNYVDDLGILNAESYDAGGMASRGLDTRLKHPANTEMPFGLVPPASRTENDPIDEIEEQEGGTRRRKKPRLEVHSADDDEEGRKKSRGRPRVDTKDETAADRRRTQIRMAQRAYRNRKETTISSLEKQVQDLRGTNEEMSNIFINLYDFAVGKGLLQREPEFGQQLQSTTERFLALAKAGSEDTNLVEPQMEEPEIPEKLATGRQKKKGRRPSPKTRKEATPPPPLSPNWAGFPIGRSASPVEDMQLDYSQENFESGMRQDLEIITRPTEDNASFPWDFTDMQQYRVEVPSMDSFPQNFPPPLELPLPKTHSYFETSFARRLQRGSLEAALFLMTQDNPDPKRINRAFGLSLRYESKETIINRVKRLLGSSAKGALQNWRAPFVHVGGAGTFYPIRDNSPVDDLMPKLRTGFSMGPFSPAVTQVQDEEMQEDLRCTIPGLEGEFFDANDVEGYLRGRGLDISPSADTVTAQLNFSLLVGAASPKSNVSNSTAPTLSPKTPKSPVEETFSADNLLTPYPPYLPNFQNNDDSLFDSGFQLDYGSWAGDATAKDVSNIDPLFFSIPASNSGRATPEVSDDRRTVTLSVDRLISEIIRRGVCLGRAPGYRPSDVNAAIIAAATAVF